MNSESNNAMQKPPGGEEILLKDWGENAISLGKCKALSVTRDGGIGPRTEE